MDKRLRQYFEALNNFSVKTKSDIKQAWQHLIKKFSLSKNDATEIIHLYLSWYFKQHNNDGGLTI